MDAARLAVLVGCGLAIAGCSGAVETFRSLRGVNKNDPDPVTAPFTGNMAAAETEPYPNLASVPPPPSRATTEAERQKLTEKLVSERVAAQAFADTSGPARPTAAKTAVPGGAPEPVPVRPAAATAQAAPTHTAAAGQMAGPRRDAASEPNQPLPRDSELQMPQVRASPEPDEPHPPPPPPRLRAVPTAAPPSQLPPAAIASVVPQPAPVVPELAPIAPPPAPAIATSEPPRTPNPTTVAVIETLDPAKVDPAQIAQIVARYKEPLGSQPLRTVRVVAYTAAPPPGADPLGGYHDALELAQGIAKALSEAGIPGKMIQTEAKPAAGPIVAGRAEIQFLP